MQLSEYLMNLDRQLELEQKELTQNLNSFWNNLQLFDSIKRYENKII